MEGRRRRGAMESALTSARQIVSDLLGDATADSRLAAGDLVRSNPAVVHERPGD